MTLDVDPDGIPVDQPDQKESVNPRPAWERIAYTWLEREVDHGQPVDPTELAAEVSVAPGLARDLVRVLRNIASGTRSSPSCGGGSCGTGSPTPTCAGNSRAAGALIPPSWRPRSAPRQR